MKVDQLVAHRGYQQYYPENTLVAISQALSVGASWVECDVQLSRDAVPLLFHDDNLKRVSGIDRNLFSFNADTLVDLSANERERLGNRFSHETIARLEDLCPLVKSHPNATFFIELKEESIAFHGIDKCLAAVSQSLKSVKDQCILISYHLQAVKKARDYGFQQTGIVFQDWARREVFLQEAAADYGFINFERINSPVISASKPIVVYEVCDPTLARSLITRGAFAVETFTIESMLSQCDDHYTIRASSQI